MSRLEVRGLRDKVMLTQAFLSRAYTCLLNCIVLFTLAMLIGWRPLEVVSSLLLILNVIAILSSHWRIRVLTRRIEVTGIRRG